MALDGACRTTTTHHCFGETMTAAAQFLATHHFETAIFDFDGTIALSGKIWHEIDSIFCKRRGLTWTPELANHIAALGLNKGAIYMVERFNLNEKPADIVAEWTEQATQMYTSRLTLRKGVESYLAQLHSAGIHTALATSNNPEVIESLEPRVAIHSLFDQIVYTQQVGKSKHYPDIYVHTAQACDTDPNNCIVFEDIVPALNSAKQAGCTTVGVFSDDPIQDVKEIQDASDCFLYDWQDLLI
ncbi:MULTISPECIES: HAD family phosphatase [Atopobium]|nr:MULTISPECIES: HAD family phosphatase [Atopobium]ERL13877.1 HAD hydrolase, family IA, variant 3 [Atopobium sp. BV3Ac4]KRN55894.1 HAD-superfamily hydrolase, subfamily IA, variant 3 [Atopobium minutum]MBS4873734.1 HAD family phosphatase [Atopobium minutum]MDU5130684.1 HAD family phosphatase [Atopobium minutum]MDU5357844.1 HAD family phosphatase [Atopobium minutum]